MITIKFHGERQGSLLGQISLANDIFNFLTTCAMCNYTDGNTLYAYNRDFHQV